MTRFAILSVLVIVALAGACAGAGPGTPTPGQGSPSPAAPTATPSPEDVIPTPTPTTTGTPGPGGELLVKYTYYNFFCGNGFPALLVYADGTVLSSGPVRCEGWPPSPTSGQRYSIGADGGARILEGLRTRGLFTLHDAALSGSETPTDPMCFSVEAHDGPDSGSAHGCRPVALLDEIVKYLDAVIAGLRGGVPYEPAAFVLYARKVKRGEVRGEPLPWPLAADVTGVSGRVVSPAEVRLIQDSAGDHGLYGHIYVQVSKGVLYVVMWQPVFPHGAP